jgi:hypothetical protein
MHNTRSETIIHTEAEANGQHQKSKQHLDAAHAWKSNLELKSKRNR